MSLAKQRGRARTGSASSRGQARPRPALVRVSEEMKQWSALLGGELERWPGVRTKPMFGFVGYYRGRKIFAALPITRAMNSANSIIFKLRGAGPYLLAKLRQDSRAKVSEKGRAGRGGR